MTTGPQDRDRDEEGQQRLSSEKAAETPPQPDAEQLETALREGGPFLVADDQEPPTDRPADVEDGPGTSLP